MKKYLQFGLVFIIFFMSFYKNIYNIVEYDKFHTFEDFSSELVYGYLINKDGHKHVKFLQKIYSEENPSGGGY